eukprot:2633153-Ditylum_brightwellii.AAC.1
MNYTKAHNHLKHQLHQLCLKQAAKDQQLTNMEKEILKAADKVLQTEHSQTTLQQQLAQTQQQAQSSIQQLSQTRSIVLQQAQELQEKANSFNQQLTSKEQQILDAGKKLAQITEEMECAKIDYHQKQHELDALKEKLLDYHHKLQQQQDAPKKQQEDLPITLDNTQKQQPEQTTTTSRGFTDESAAISQNDFDYGGHMMGCGHYLVCNPERRSYDKAALGDAACLCFKYDVESLERGGKMHKFWLAGMEERVSRSIDKILKAIVED